MKNFEQLTLEELNIVFNKNEKLQNIVLEAAQEDINFWISEYMNCFECGTIKYNIGYPGNYIVIQDGRKFIEGLFKLQTNFCYLSEEGEKALKYCDVLIDKYDNLSLSCDNSDMINSRIDEIMNDLKNEFLENLVNEYNYYNDFKNLSEYFKEFYSDTMNDNYYVDDDYILYQHIEYEKCYK